MDDEARPCSQSRRVPTEIEVRHVDVGLPARDHIAEDASRASGHGPAERTVTRTQHEVAVAGAADHRSAVGRHWAQAAPETSLAQISRLREQLAQGTVERTTPMWPQRELPAGDLGCAADADAV